MPQSLSLDALLSGQVFALVLIFARLGSAFMLLPGFGDTQVSPRIRLLLALALAFVLLPVLKPLLPALPRNAAGLFVLMALETFIGVFLGTVTRMLTASLEIAGQFLSQVVGLSNASVFNPAIGTQESVIGSILTQTGILLIFATDLHHLLISAVIDSYTLFKPGAALPVGDFASYMTQIVGQSITIGAEMSVPFLIVGVLSNIGLALLSRLMPQFPILNLAMSAQVVVGVGLVAITVSAMMMFWLQRFEDALTAFLSRG